jgi:hypothetical protein
MAIETIQTVIAAIAGLAALLSIGAAFRAGILRRIRFGAFEIEASPQDKAEARALIEAVAQSRDPDLPFETEQLARYYAQVLAQSRISFWFSLVFASLGFAVIVVAGFMYTSASSGATIAQFIAGLVMDAVAALFFVQSKSAQASMGEFFDKLRRDRQQAESRKLCESITNPQARDALRVQLALHYAEVPESEKISSAIMTSCLVQSREEVRPQAAVVGPLDSSAGAA